MRTAILIDAQFFLHRYRAIKGKSDDAGQIADALHQMALEHVRRNNHSPLPPHQLYRIFVYDCPPLRKKVQHPLSGKPINFETAENTKFRLAFHEELRKRRKVALRLGYLDDRNAHWTIHKPKKLHQVLIKKITIDGLQDSDVTYYARQKGVDIRIGLDIASLALKRQVNQIILVSGDSDFVPAAKMARREGIDFILDPMWANIRPDLNEHIDGLSSIWPNPHKAEVD